MSQGFVPPPSGAPGFQPPQTPAAPATPPVIGAAQPPAPGAVPFAGAQQPPAPGPPPASATSDWPPAGGYGQGYLPVAPGPQPRPAVIALACTMAVVASLQWICGLSLAWVTATTAVSTFAEVGDDGALFHIFNRFNYRMMDGLAIPLFGFPLASVVTGFAILSGRAWTRLLHTLVGAAALAWAAWWLQGNLLFWFSAAWYVAVACLVLWTPGATAWYRRPDRAGQS